MVGHGWFGAISDYRPDYRNRAGGGGHPMRRLWLVFVVIIYNIIREPINREDVLLCRCWQLLSTVIRVSNDVCWRMLYQLRAGISWYFTGRCWQLLTVTDNLSFGRYALTCIMSLVMWAVTDRCQQLLSVVIWVSLSLSLSLYIYIYIMSAMWRYNVRFYSPTLTAVVTCNLRFYHQMLTYIKSPVI